MTVQAVVEDLGTVASELREFYEERDDGKYQLKLEGAETSEEIAGLKKALKAERKSAREASSRVESLERKFQDIDPERYRELLEAAEEADRKKAEAAGEWDALKAKLEAKHQKALEAQEAELKRMRDALHFQLIEAEATRAISEAGGEPRLLLPHVRARCKVIDEDDTFEVRVLDAHGEPELNDAGGFQTIPELVDALKADEVFGRAFDASGASGGGAPAARRKTGTGKVTTRADLKDDKARADFIHEHGSEAYLELPAS